MVLLREGAALGLCPRPRSYADSARGASPSGLPFSAAAEWGLYWPFLPCRQPAMRTAGWLGYRSI